MSSLGTAASDEEDLLVLIPHPPSLALLKTNFTFLAGPSDRATLRERIARIAVSLCEQLGRSETDIVVKIDPENGRR